MFLNCTPSKFSAQWNETTSGPKKHRSERTRSCCRCSVASLLNSFSSFSTRSAAAHSNMSATSSTQLSNQVGRTVDTIQLVKLYWCIVVIRPDRSQYNKLQCRSSNTIQNVYNTHTHPFNGPSPGLPRSAGTRKVKPIWILLKQERVSGSGIRRVICKPAPHSRQITTPAPHRSVFTGRMPFLPPNQQRQSTEGQCPQS